MEKMKFYKIIGIVLCLCLAAGSLAGCTQGGANTGTNGNAANASNSAGIVKVQDGPTEEEMTRLADITLAGAEAIPADKLNEGKYDITVKSGSEQFKVKSAKLIVVGNAMQLLMNVEGSDCSRIFAGKASDAASGTAIIGEDNGDGTVSFRLPLKSLNEVTGFAAYSEAMGKWYDRTVVADSASLDAAAVKPAVVANDPQSQNIQDGDYSVSVDFSGGTGKAKITSPATLHVSGGALSVTVVWSSKNYDYMIVGGNKYLAESTENGSVFTFPIPALDTPVNVIGDTTAMGSSHEIEYTVSFSLN